MRWFALGQRVLIRESFETARILAAGYVVEDNRIDIIDAFWVLRFPGWTFEYCPWTDDFRWAQRLLMHTRGRGFFMEFDFGDYQWR